MSEIDGINLPRWGAEDENETWGLIHQTDNGTVAQLAGGGRLKISTVRVRIPLVPPISMAP